MLITRQEYLDKLISFQNKQLIKVVTGVRRCGKSTLLEQFQSHLISQGISSTQIMAINFEDFEFDELRDPKKLYAYIKERLLPDKMNYIFLD